MSRKVILILVDGMRPDAMMKCGNEYANELVERSSYSLCASAVDPAVTLPCHMSLFLSVEPKRHGVLTNTYTPQVRPVEGLVERLNTSGKKCAFFYSWEELRDLVRPGNLHRSVCMNMYTQRESDNKLTAQALEYIKEESPDFVFLYLGETDDVGHNHGWMSDEYMACISNALECIKRVFDSVGDEYTIMVTADHGGHDRGHGADIPEDMLIPLCICGEGFEAGKTIENATIMDIAPTIAKLMDVSFGRDWEGKPLF